MATTMKTMMWYKIEVMAEMMTREAAQGLAETIVERSDARSDITNASYGV